MASTVKSTQEQATAAWVSFLNQVRFEEYIAKLEAQDLNLQKALEALEEIRNFLANPQNILGSAKSKHGEIAEYLHVYISNARALILGQLERFSFDGVARTAPEDFLKDGNPVQSKFLQGPSGANSFNAVKKHLDKYMDFFNQNGTYVIPKDQYEMIMELLSKPSSELSRSEYTLVQAIRAWEKLHGVLFSQVVEPATVTYAQAQVAVAGDTVDAEEAAIREQDKQIRDEAFEDSKASVKEGAKVAAVSAAIEGSVAFLLSVHRKIKEGKKIGEFTAEDWKDVGIDTGVGVGKGTVRGSVVYAMTNLTSTPAAVASALVTATLGVSYLSYNLQQGNITPEEFLEQSQVMCLDVSISAVSSVAGQIAIPIPILGAVIGNATGMFLYGIAKNNLSKRETQLIQAYQDEINRLNLELDQKYQDLLKDLQQRLEEFILLLENAFSSDDTIALAGSIALAQYIGVSEKNILKTDADIDAYFLGE